MEIQVDFPGGKKVDAQFKNFRVQTDQSKAQGGDGEHPTPFDLFLASLATCAGIYVLRFCEKRGLETKDVRISMQNDWNKETNFIENISITIHLPSTFPEKYKSAVIRAAEQCTVKKHFHQPPQFNIQTEIEA